jgi:hypothetical protein
MQDACSGKYPRFRYGSELKKENLVEMEQPIGVGGVWPVIIGTLYDMGLVSRDVYTGNAAPPAYVWDMVNRIAEVTVAAYQQGQEAARTEMSSRFSDVLPTATTVTERVAASKKWPDYDEHLAV